MPYPATIRHIILIKFVAGKAMEKNMSTSNSKNKENKNIKALFSVICLCIIALGLIVYFSTSAKQKNNPVNEATTIVETTEVQHAVTVEETTEEQTEPQEVSEVEQTTVPTSMPQGDSNTPYKSYYKYPLTESVIKGYSQELVFDKTMNDYRAHTAVDFAGAEGDKVASVNDGLVTAVYTDGKYGLCVEIDHGAKLVVTYCGLNSTTLKKGDFVDIGNTVGILGKVPCENAEESHLHVSAVLDGASVNILDIMGKTE